MSAQLSVIMKELEVNQTAELIHNADMVEILLDRYIRIKPSMLPTRDKSFIAELKKRIAIGKPFGFECGTLLATRGTVTYYNVYIYESSAGKLTVIRPPRNIMSLRWGRYNGYKPLVPDLKTATISDILSGKMEPGQRYSRSSLLTVDSDNDYLEYGTPRWMVVISQVSKKTGVDYKSINSVIEI